MRKSDSDGDIVRADCANDTVRGKGFYLKVDPYNPFDYDMKAFDLVAVTIPKSNLQLTSE